MSNAAITIGFQEKILSLLFLVKAGFFTVLRLTAGLAVNELFLLEPNGDLEAGTL